MATLAGKPSYIFCYCCDFAIVFDVVVVVVVVVVAYCVIRVRWTVCGVGCGSLIFVSAVSIVATVDADGIIIREDMGGRNSCMSPCFFGGGFFSVLDVTVSVST